MPPSVHDADSVCPDRGSGSGSNAKVRLEQNAAEARHHEREKRAICGPTTADATSQVSALKEQHDDRTDSLAASKSGINGHRPNGSGAQDACRRMTPRVLQQSSAARKSRLALTG